MKNFLAHTDEIRKQMLDEISLASVDDLFKQIPVKFKDFNLYNPKSEMEAQKEIKKLARKNKTEYANFLGGGVYNKFIPACVNYIAQRFEFLTAYTPYQPEISQGTLQIIYELHFLFLLSPLLLQQPEIPVSKVYTFPLKFQVDAANRNP